MEHPIRFAVLALLEQESATLADILPLFLDKEFRKVAVAALPEGQVRHFWTVEYGKLRYQFSPDASRRSRMSWGHIPRAPAHAEGGLRTRKADPLPAADGRLRHAGREPRKRGRLGADILNLLGGLIVSGIVSAAYRRQNKPEETLQPFVLYADEFHSFTSSAFAGMLSELPKYGLGLTLTTYFSQIELEPREAILGNVGTL